MLVVGRVATLGVGSHVRVDVVISVAPSRPSRVLSPNISIRAAVLVGAGGVSGSLCQRGATGGENCVEFFTGSGPGDRTDRNSPHRRGLFDFPPTPTVFYPGFISLFPDRTDFYSERICSDSK